MRATAKTLLLTEDVICSNSLLCDVQSLCNILPANIQSSAIIIGVLANVLLHR